MKNYTITVNGTAYEVTVEETGSVSAPAAAAPAAARRSRLHDPPCGEGAPRQSNRIRRYRSGPSARPCRRSKRRRRRLRRAAPLPAVFTGYPRCRHRGGAARRQHQKRGDRTENGQPFFHRSFPFQMRKRTAAGHRKLYGVRGCPRK